MATDDLHACVLEAARQCLAGGERLTIAAVATRAGLGRSRVYRLFGSRAALLAALELEPEPGSRERILDAALALVGRDSLARLSMDDLAAAAGVSRASLYRLFPGKPALFRELMRTFSPMEAIAATVHRLAGAPPEVMMPAIARTVATTMAGRIGIIRSLFLEVTSMAPDTGEGFAYAYAGGIEVLQGYVVQQMAAGRLRSMHPLLALQSFAGPILLHLLTRDLAERRLSLTVPLADTATQLAEHWLRAMRPAVKGTESHGTDGG